MSDDQRSLSDYAETQQTGDSDTSEKDLMTPALERRNALHGCDCHICSDDTITICLDASMVTLRIPY